MEDRRNKRRSSAPWLIGGAVMIVVLAAILIYMVGIGRPNLTPEEVARQWVNDNVDLAGELLAGWIIGVGPVEPPGAAGWLAKEIGGELIEDKIHEVIKWDYSSARDLGDGWEVTATASVSFPEYAGFEAGLPMVLRIDGQGVSDWRPDYMAAYARADIPGIGDVVEVASSVSEVINAEDCLEAARDAGVPDSVIEYLNKPISDRNFLEKTAIETAVDAVSLPDGCADSLMGQ